VIGVMVMAVMLGAPAPVSGWADVVALLKVSPRWGVTQAQVDVAKAGAVGARRLPNTEVSYGGTFQVAGTSPGNETTHELVVAQPFLIGGQRGARGRAVKREVALAEREALLDARDLVAEARAAWTSLVAARAKKDLLVAGVAATEKLAAVVKARADAGHASTFDIERAEAAVAQVASERDASDATIAAAEHDLAVALGVQVAVAATTLTVPSELPQVAAADTPSAQVAVAAQARAAADIEVAKAERWPDLVLQVGTVQGSGPYSGAVSVGAAIEVPWLDFGEGPVAEAEARTRAAAQLVEVQDQTTESTLAAARAAFEQRSALVVRHDTDVIARLEGIATRADAAYAEGRITLFERLDSERDLLDARLRRVELVVDVLEAEGRYRDAAGLD